MFTFHTDAGHAWLEVPLEIMNEQLKAWTPSRYSYVDKKNQVAYLEEDFDAARFLEWYAARLIPATTSDQLVYKNINHDGDCFIRKLPRFQSGG